MESQGKAKWYIATSIIGNEDVVFKNLEDKIRAYQLNDVVHEIKLLKSREITIEIFDNKDNPPPKIMRNSKSITWETLPGNRYKKTRIREVNRFPGYIYIKMIMSSEAWYIIRNTFGITGFVGSSGKGAQPIPMSDFEVESLFSEANNQDIIINKSDMDYVENTVEESSDKESTVEFYPNIDQIKNKPFVVPVDDEGFYNSSMENQTNSNDALNEIQKDIEENDNSSIYLEEENDNNNQTSDTKMDYPGFENVRIGSFVKIINGEMKDSIGTVSSINNLLQKLNVEIEFLGRKSNIEVSFDDITVDFE